MHEGAEINHAFLLLFLPLPGFMVLEPIEHILPFYMPIRFESACYLLYLIRRGGSHPLPIQLLQYVDLLSGGIPSRARMSASNHHLYHTLLISTRKHNPEPDVACDVHEKSTREWY